MHQLIANIHTSTCQKPMTAWKTPELFQDLGWEAAWLGCSECSGPLAMPKPSIPKGPSTTKRLAKGRAWQNYAKLATPHFSQILLHYSHYAPLLFAVAFTPCARCGGEAGSDLIHCYSISSYLVLSRPIHLSPLLTVPSSPSWVSTIASASPQESEPQPRVGCMQFTSTPWREKHTTHYYAQKNIWRHTI